MIREALKQVGAARSIVIDETNEVLAGNGVLAAAIEAGLANVQIVEADGQTVIAVRRRNLSPEQKRALAMFDNRTNELSAWNLDQLRLDQAAGLAFSDFFTDEELAKVLGVVPSFTPVDEDEQGRLDQKAPITCPECGHVFTL